MTVDEPSYSRFKGPWSKLSCSAVQHSSVIWTCNDWEQGNAETEQRTHTYRGTAPSFAAECCLSELCNGSPEAFQPLTEVSKLVVGCSNTELSTGPPSHPRSMVNQFTSSSIYLYLIMKLQTDEMIKHLAATENGLPTPLDFFSHNCDLSCIFPPISSH